MKPLLSILICAIPSRWEMVNKLYNRLTKMCEGKDIEVLMLMDNKKRTIGEKREALKKISNGKYFIFIDDDDDLFSVDELYEAAKTDVDVITFNVQCFNSDGSEFIVTYGLGNEIEHNTKNGRYLDSKRPPFSQAAWHERFKEIKFPSVMWGEDWGWAKQANDIAKSETFIDKVLVAYNFDPKTSEAAIPVKRVIVNFSTEGFLPGQKRLIKSINEDFKTDACLFCFTPETLECPDHEESPYAFKIYAIEKARETGYQQILWVDASVYAVKNIQPVWDWLTEKGIFFEEAGHYAGTWAPENVLKYFGITKKQAMKMPMFAAGYCGFDFTNPISIEFFAEWKEAMLNGMFKGNVEESRHDMTAGSIIANKMGLQKLYSPGGHFFAYVGEGYSKPLETAVFHLQGL